MVRRFRPVRTSAGLALDLIPVVMAVAALLTIVGDFKANTVGVAEVCCPVVGCVLGVALSLRCFDACTTELLGKGNNFSR